MSDLPTGTVTFLFTDIEGSTRLLQQLGPRYADVLADQRAQLRAAWAAHDGHEVDTQGDSFFVAFARAADAVAAAAQAQQALLEHPWPDAVPVRVRMGLHTGTPLVTEAGYVGLDVHRAARIAVAGHGAQILLSEATRGLVEHDLPAGASLRDLGAYQLKDLQRPEHLYQLVLPDLPADFPPLKTLDRHAHNLPIQFTLLLGREEAVASVCARLRRDDMRLVTLTGPGGVGKTRLGLQVAAELMDEFADGVWFVGLSRLVDPTLVLPTIAQTLGLQEAGSRPIEELLRDHVRTRQLLLLLDNFEQVVAAATPVADLLATSRGLKVLVTSRVTLHLQGEQEYPVPPLALPAERHAESPAVTLFAQRAQASRPDFQLTETTAPIVAAICARLDGLPLAITLAAAWVKLLPPQVLAQRLERRLPLLTGGARNLEARQQTMRNTLAWSEGLLSPEERVLFRRLSVFVGGGTLEAAEAVCVAPEGAEPLAVDLLDGLGRLVDQSLIQQREEGGEPRFGMLHVIREFALEQLEASGEAEALRWAHAAYYVAFAEQMWAASTADNDMEAYLARIEQLEAEQDNLRAALGWLRARAEAARQTGGTGRPKVERAGTRRGVEAPMVQGLRLAGALLWPWAYRGHLGEGRAWLEAFLALEAPSRAARPDQAERGGASPAARRGGSRTGAAPGVSATWVRARALYAAGVLAYWQGDSAQAVPLLEQSLALSQVPGDRLAMGYALNNLGMALQDQGDLERARACYEESMALGRALDDWSLVANPLVNLSLLTLAAGDLDQAAVYSEEALAVSRQWHYHTGAAASLIVQALLAWRCGQLSRAAALAQEALMLHHASRDVRHYGDGLEVCAMLCATRGRAEPAARLLGATAASRERIGMRRKIYGPTVADIEAAVAPAQAALGEQQWAAAFAAGQALSVEEAIAEALADEG